MSALDDAIALGRNLARFALEHKPNADTIPVFERMERALDALLDTLNRDDMDRYLDAL